ncbi:MAG: nickel pincer cofactor biosynthesis protein LarC [Myxococcales bacterium]|nr:nickel pincer cofactor biosynthesis protein LarC [Myxococcales bacterium]
MSLHGKHLHFDCASGIAGDMCMGALIDVGVPADVVREAISNVGLGEDRLRVEAVVKSGIGATNVWVRCEDGQTETHGHAVDHATDLNDGNHAHHHYSEIRSRIEGSSLAPGVVKLSLAIFDKVAEAEARMHGMTLQNVAFHEVGAIDSIVDVIGCAAALHWLSPSSVSSSPVAMGKGVVKCAHGILPVPSPAAVEILRKAKAPVSDGGLAIELCTPTGAAILASVVTQWGSMPEMVPESIGYGSGDLELPDRPNVVRVILGEPSSGTSAKSDVVIEISANIDDMSPELCDFAMEQLVEAGALDVWWTPITMKKGRPALGLGVLCTESAQSEVTAAIFRETTSIGVRYRRMERTVLLRSITKVETKYGTVAVKVAREGKTIVNAAPEYEDCRALAVAKGVSLKLVFAAAVAAATEQA